VPKNLIPTIIAVLCLSVASGPLVAAQQHELTVQTEGKADSRLVVEAPQVVETWTGKCTAAEEVKNPYAPMCWRNAASAVAEYAAGFESPLIELRRLPATWLQRAARLQSPRLSPMGRPPEVKSASTDTAVRTVRKAIPPNKPQRVGQVKPSITVQRPQKPMPSERTNGIKVVPTAYVSRHTGRPETSRRKAEIWSIREELKKITERLNCLSRRCITGGN
jgi:hypothetical protein